MKKGGPQRWLNYSVVPDSSHDEEIGGWNGKKLDQVEPVGLMTVVDIQDFLGHMVKNGFVAVVDYDLGSGHNPGDGGTWSPNTISMSGYGEYIYYKVYCVY